MKKVYIKLLIFNKNNMTKYNQKIAVQLSLSEKARNNHKMWYIEYIQSNYCETEIEKAIIEKVLRDAITQASYQRSVAYIQNTLWFFQPNKEVKEERIQQEEKKRGDHSSFWTSIWRRFRKQ